MKRQKEADILCQIIRLARSGLTQASIASRIGVKPSKVYGICKRYGIKTKHAAWLNRMSKNSDRHPVQLLLPM